MNTQTQEAFEKFWNTEIVSAVTGSVDTAMWGDIDRNETAYIFMAGFKACKEALEQEPLNLNCKSVQKRLATQWGYVEQPAQEPVAIVYSMQDGYIGQMVVKDIPHKTKLYTHPAPSWQGLSDDEIEVIDADCWVFPEDESELFNHYKFARAIEQALKEKNHG